jgi:predicted alpha/beta-hydrolase family hydrolase
VNTTAITIALDGGVSTSGLWLEPKGAKAAYVFAHGAGVGMAHKAMAAIAEGLAARGTDPPSP